MVIDKKIELIIRWQPRSNLHGHHKDQRKMWYDLDLGQLRAAEQGLSYSKKLLENKSDTTEEFYQQYLEQ
jgi:hypothetical protein